MIVESDKLKKFVGLVGIGAFSNFEAKVEDGVLEATVVSAHIAVLITAKLPVSIDEGEEVKIYANADIFLKKYLDVFDKTTLTIETNDDVVVMTDDNLTLYMPQISPEVAAKNTGRLKKEVEFDVKVTFPAKDFKRIYKAMNRLDEDSITFAIKGRKLEILAGKKAILKSDAEIEGDAEVTKIFSKVVLDDALGKADGLITLEFNSKVTGDYPVRFSYETDGIEVEGLMMPLRDVEEEGEESGEE